MLIRFRKIDSSKPEQIETLESILADRNVLAILPTDFPKILMYQAFSLA